MPAIRQRIPPSQFAWWYLSGFQKGVLEKERRAGRFEFGGMGDKAPYLFAMEGSKKYADGKPYKSAEKAGNIRFGGGPMLFIERGIEQGRLTSAQVSAILLSK